MGALVNTAEYDLSEAQWRDCKSACIAIRRQVFIVEQGVPESEEWDGRDDKAIHFVVYQSKDKRAVACARLLSTPSDAAKSGSIAKITRMAVVQPHRGRGIGQALLKIMQQRARADQAYSVALDAQLHALEFYAKEGFVPEGKPFIDAGIEHITMSKQLY